MYCNFSFINLFTSLYFMHYLFYPLLYSVLECPERPLACPPNSSYSLCVSSCPETCLGAVGPPGCEDVCVEGCECNPGFILSNDKCVALKDCGCVDTSGTYHPVSRSIF
uniref:TIL domain-containing protein n=1 Tax=Sphaeramia orbicularis TaxID=375764 RepID=A0A672YLK6_9TELE